MRCEITTNHWLSSEAWPEARNRVNAGQYCPRTGQPWEPEEAYKSYLEAVKLQREIGDKKGLGVTLINLGQLYTERSRHEEALKAYKESLQIQRDVGDENQQAFCLNNIGNVYLAKGQSSDALTYYERALELRKKANIPSQVGEAFTTLERLH